jgi:hypothetical protein
MSIARESFMSNNNPFSLIAKNTDEKQTVVSQSQAEIKEKEAKTTPLHKFVEKAEKNQENVGFKLKDIYTGATTQNKLIREQIATMQVQNAMEEAREGLATRKSFMGALEFLNSQAGIYMASQRKARFDKLA